MKTDDVYVKKSLIEGRGVFAARDFKKGDIVLQWDTSCTLTDEDVKKVPEDIKKYVSNLHGKNILMQEPERFVNHSCEANTTAKDFADVAIRDILKDEEITANYSEEFIQSDKMICHCGSEKCRKIIKTEDEK